MGIRLSRCGIPSLAFLGTLACATPLLEQPGPLQSELTFWSVGQGDFITYVTQSQCLVFDVGGSFQTPAKLLRYLKDSCGLSGVELFISHFDKDHISNYRVLLSALRVRNAFFSHLEPRSKFGQHMLNDLKEAKAHVQIVRAGFIKNLAAGVLTCLWPQPFSKLGKAENDRSLVFRLQTKGRTFLLTGDLPSKLEKKLNLFPTEVLKAGHHGSQFSSSDLFLKNLKPKMCIVSVGENNKYGHPARGALRRMAYAHCAILRTDILGDIHIAL